MARLIFQPYGLWKHRKINREGAKVREGQASKNPRPHWPSRRISFANLRALRVFAVDLWVVRPGSQLGGRAYAIELAPGRGPADA